MEKRKKSLLYESSARARMCFVYAQNCMHESLAPLHKIHTKTNTTTQIYTHICSRDAFTHTYERQTYGEKPLPCPAHAKRCCAICVQTAHAKFVAILFLASIKLI